MFRIDRTKESGKTKGGGVCFMNNNAWCDSRNISVLSCSCSPQLEHLPAPGVHTIIAVYIPQQAEECKTLSANIIPSTAFIVVEDFNKVNLTKVMPNFSQHVTCPTRGVNTLDHCYTQYHAAIFLMPEYKQSLRTVAPATREIRCWSAQLVALCDVDWDMFQESFSSNGC